MMGGAGVLNFIEIHYQLYKKLSLSISHNPLPGKVKVLLILDIQTFVSELGTVRPGSTVLIKVLILDCYNY